MELQVSEALRKRLDQGEISAEDLRRFTGFVDRCNRELMQHTVITDNEYTAWFSRGEQSLEDVTHFIVQFSVFSNQFLIAQLRKMINSPSLEGMRASKEILANEIGVIFNSGKKKTTSSTDTDREGDPELVSVEGTVDGGKFRFKAAHFEWLLRIGRQLDLTFNDMGKRCHGSPSTLFFCDQLAEIYGSEDPAVAEGASFAVENWAAAGFWKELIRGLDSFRAREQMDLPLAFFTWHDKIEDQHAGHVMDELEEAFFAPYFDADKFIEGGRRMLDGVEAFWIGLNENRIARAHRLVATAHA